VRELRSAREQAEKATLEWPDAGFLVALVGLLSVGLIMVYSTTAIDASWSDILKIVVQLAVGVAGMVVAMHIPLRVFRKWTLTLLVVCVILLLSLYVPGNPLRYSMNGATRWINLVGGFKLQPSEFTKLAFILFGAQFLERRAHRMTTRNWGAFALVFCFLAAIIYKEPDLGTALVLGGTAFSMLIAAGISGKKLLAGALIGAALVLTLAWYTPHQKERLLSWWNPWAEVYRLESGHQVIRSWSAMARGGLWGVGLGQSTQKLDNRLPESETDFIFAIVAEELGYVRAVGVLGLFALFIWRGYTIAARATDRYAGLVAAGITSWVAVQACMNVAVATGSIPNTGVPLPFISSGGSSLLALLISVGIVLGISRHRRQVDRNPLVVSVPRKARAPRPR
jgi:cell division protein FtsW